MIKSNKNPFQLLKELFVIISWQEKSAFFFMKYFIFEQYFVNNIYLKWQLNEKKSGWKLKMRTSKTKALKYNNDIEFNIQGAYSLIWNFNWIILPLAVETDKCAIARCGFFFLWMRHVKLFNFVLLVLVLVNMKRGKNIIFFSI